MNIRFLELGVALGETLVGNDCYFDHFEKQGKDVRHFMENIMGRDLRVESNKTSLELGIESAENALLKNNLEGTDLDIIIYSTNIAEYIVPPSSIFIHNKLGGKPECFCFDMNINCAGMMGALRLAVSYLSSNPTMQRAMIVGSDNLRRIANPENEVCYGTHGDAACSLIIEKTNTESKIFGFNSVIDSGGCFKSVRFPKNGMNELLDRVPNISKKDTYVSWEPFNGAYPIPFASKQINELLEQNSLTMDDLSVLCFSQFNIYNIKKIEKALGIDSPKSIYIGHKYGYTGTNSPFLALNEAINTGKIKRGDLYLMWTLGIGFESIAMLGRY